MIFPLNSSIAVQTTAAIAPVDVVLFDLTLFLRAISLHSNVLYTLQHTKIRWERKHFEYFVFTA